MRVLVITSAFPAREGDPRGTFIDQLVRAIAEQGVEVIVLAPGAPGAASAEVRHGVQVRRAAYWIGPWQTLASGVSGIVPNLRRRPWLIAQLPFLIVALTWHAVRLARGATLIHAHWVYPAGLAGLAAARARGIPLVVTGHGGDLNLARRSRVLRVLVRWVGRSADLCIGVSHAMVDEFRRNGVPAERVHFIPLGVAPAEAYESGQDHLDPLRQEFVAQPGLRVVYVGGLIPQKSVITLLKAHAIAQERGGEIACLIVGAGPTESSLRAFVRERQLRGVFFAGQQAPDTIRGWIRSSHVLVLPSLAEGRGLVLVEAMAEGLPVVASDIPGPRELALPGRTGFLFPPGDADALADCLRRLTDLSVRRRLGEAGRVLVEKQGLTVDASARRHVAIYRTLEAAPHRFREEGARRESGTAL